MELPDKKTFFDEMEEHILEIQNNCNYFVPQFIIDDYYKNLKCKKKSRNIIVKKPVIEQATTKKVNTDVLINIEDADNSIETSMETSMETSIENNNLYHDEPDEHDNPLSNTIENEAFICNLDGIELNSVGIEYV